MNLHAITNDNTTRPSNDELRDMLERQVAAKIIAMLPADDAATRRILAHAGDFHARFTSVAACRAVEAGQ